MTNFYFRAWNLYNNIKKRLSGIGLTATQRQDLDYFLSRAIREGYLDDYQATTMTYQAIQNYLSWSDYMANS